MGMIERLAGHFGYRRIKTQSNNHHRQRVQARMFDAAIIDRKSYAWGVNGASLDGMIYAALVNLRRRSRKLAHNNEYAKNFVRMAKQNIVGPTGFIFQSKARTQAGALDRADNVRIETAWRRQSKRANFCVNGRQSRDQAEALAVEYLIRDGEILMQKVPGFEKNETGFAIRFLDPDRLDINVNKVRDPRSGLRTIMGVTLDDDDRPVAYHLLTKHPEGSYLQTEAMTGQTHIVLPAEQIEHIFLPMGGEQHRGVPWFHASILSLKDIGAYREAAIIAARVGAAKMGFFTSPEGDSFTGDGRETDADGEEGATITTAEPGTFEQLVAGTEFQTYDPTYPHEQFADFNKEMLHGVAVSLGAAYHNITGNLEGVNFSSSRMGEFKEHEVWLTLQHFVSQSFDQMIYEDWLRFKLATDTLDGIPPQRFAKFSTPTWQGRRWEAVQPVEQQKANAMAYGLRTKSISGIIRDSAQDPEEVWAEMAEDNERLKAMGLEPSLITTLKPDDGDDKKSSSANDES